MSSPLHAQQLRITTTVSCREKLIYHFSTALRNYNPRFWEKLFRQFTAVQNRAIPALIRAGLVLDIFGIESAKECESQQPIGKALSKSPVVVALNKVARAMSKLGYVLHKGEVLKKRSFNVYI